MEGMETHRAGATFEELAVPLIGELYNFAHWLAQDRTESEDLVQESLMKGLKAFSSFQPGTNFRAWMFRILRNTFLSSRTGKKFAATVALDPEDETSVPRDDATPEALFLSNADAQAVQDTLQELPLHFREIVLLCDLEEMSYAEIAETLSIPIGTVMSRLARARQALRQRLRARIGGR